MNLLATGGCGPGLRSSDGLVLSVGGERTLSVNLTRRMHGLLNESVDAAVIQLPLSPVERFLFIKPNLRKRRSAKCAATSLQEVDHGQGIVTLQ